MGGHSLGGAMAAEYVSKHVDEFDGLYLFAAYSTADLSDSDLRVFSVYGSEDGVLDMDKYRKYRSNLPEDTYEYVIDAGAILILEAMVCKRETVHLMWLSRSR